MRSITGSRTAAARLRFGATSLGAIVGLYYVLVVLGTGAAADASAYQAAPLAAPYGSSTVGGPLAYMYSPAFRQAIEPLVAAGPAFVVALRLAELAALVYLAGPLTLLALFLPPVASELAAGNVNLLVAAAIVLGLRHPAAWAFVLLTKVTPGVGLVYFAVRREWRHLAIALAATSAIALASIALAPALWPEWIATLTRNASVPTSTFGFVWLPLPIAVRLAIGAALAAWGGISGRPSRMLLGAWVAYPSTWYLTLAVWTALLRLGDVAPRPIRLSVARQRQNAAATSR